MVRRLDACPRDHEASAISDHRVLQLVRQLYLYQLLLPLLLIVCFVTIGMLA